MGTFRQALSDSDIEWIHKQKVYFVSTAPLNKGGHVNASPKGYDTLRVLNGNRIVFLDGRGSGCETISHLRENGRITVMLCAFEGSPRIMRLFGTGTVYEPGTSEFDSLFSEHYASEWGSAEKLKLVRTIIDIKVHLVGQSCGFAVPLMNFESERKTLVNSYKSETEEVIAKKCNRDNSFSIDGIPSFIKGTSGTKTKAKIKHGLVSATGTLLPWVGGAALGAAIALAAVRSVFK
ncbi:hypothetical protein LPJ64_002274 [Coemansia asiatica]|uniref:Pyridoxamine 5'-phosphate oxidase N-terminal domain-containing protein n=1 Tax=Coemansia asiatica TaxID=1052880 RepID=A0A9W7XJW2_9FUNG|nr:hypothetical protein LPJ64_002274 [Coemansia asiatica]